ncbi:glycosyltransferase family 39 protein [bacterium]|nr:glycosyltransferase family 39 protein [bacterium]
MIKDKFVDLVKAKGFWIIFSLVLVVGLALRLLLINTPLWYDEACSWLAASKSFPSGINDFLLNHDFQHTPLYFYYLHFWMKFFGNSDISLRLSSLLPSLFILPLVYLTARQITSKFASLIVMFLVSVNVFQICYASEVRMYNLVILFALLSVFAMLRYIKDFKTSQLAEMVLYNVILSYLMIGSPVFIIAQIICLCSYLSQAGNKEQLRKVLISNGIFFILLIPYFLILEHYFLIRQDFLMVHSAELSFLSIIGILQKFLSQSLENGMYWVTINPYIIGTKEFFIFLIPCLLCCAQFIKR